MFPSPEGYMQHVANQLFFAQLIYAVDENFLDAAYDQFFVVQEAQSDISYPSTPNGKKDVVRSLFQNPSAVTADNTLKGNIPPVIGSMKGDSVRCNI
jgi:hypothetical protein